MIRRSMASAARRKEEPENRRGPRRRNHTPVQPSIGKSGLWIEFTRFSGPAQSVSALRRAPDRFPIWSCLQTANEPTSLRSTLLLSVGRLLNRTAPDRDL